VWLCPNSLLFYTTKKKRGSNHICDIKFCPGSVRFTGRTVDQDVLPTIKRTLLRKLISIWTDEAPKKAKNKKRKIRCR
jgi:hypothetical protein